MSTESIHLRVTHIPRCRGTGKQRRWNSSANALDYIRREGRYTEAYLAKLREKSEEEERLVSAGHLYMPPWGLRGDSPRPFFEAADEYERVNGRLSTRIEAAIPRDIYTAGLAEELIERFATRRLKGHPTAYGIHCTTASDGGQQPHVHIQFTERLITGVAPPPEKFFLRANPHHPEKGGCGKDRAMNAKGFVTDCRRTWSDLSNELLAEIGSEVRVDPRSLEARGIKRLPGYHHGPTFDARFARAEQKILAGEPLTEADFIKPTPSMERWNELRKKLAPIEKELSELKLQQENEMKIEIAKQQRAQAAHRNAAAAQTQEIHMRITRDRERQRVLSEAEADDIRRDVIRALAGWHVKWKRTAPGEMPAFVARSGPHRIDFDGREIVGHDESEETLSRMVAIAKAAGKKRVEITGSPTAKRRLAELCQAAGIEVVEPTAPKPMTVTKPAATPNVPAPTPFDINNGPTPFTH